MEVDTTSSNASLKAKTTPGPKSNFAPGFVFFFLWEGGTCLSKEEAHCLHFTGSLSCIDFDGFSLCNRGHLVQWFSAGNYYGPKWGLPLLKLHFSCNLGAFTLFLQSVTPPPPQPKTPGAALKQPLETADLQDHLPLRVCVRAGRFVDGWKYGLIWFC